MSTIQEHGINSDNSFTDAECFQCTGESINSHWEQIEPLVAKWLEVTDGEYDLNSILRFGQLGLMQFFCIHVNEVIKLVTLTEIVQYPMYKVLRVIGIAGERPFLLFKFFPAFEAWARANEVKYIDTLATEHTVKLDQRLGFKARYTFMRKNLEVLH